jgi:L-alanine-DL-glutamate epimerase-like enolase superfamily enzyme
MARTLDVFVERFPIAGTFTIARGSRTEAVVVRAVITDGSNVGQGECVPYSRYGESVEGVAADIEAMRDAVAGDLDRLALQSAMKAGAARNALDCALWDLEAKMTGVPAHVAAGLARMRSVTTCYTISLGTPESMAEATAAAAQRPILKIKLGGADGDLERIAAVRRAAPDSILVADANEGWTDDRLESHLAACAEAGFSMIEQPLPAAADERLRTVSRAVPVCADESVHDRASLPRLVGLYDVVNIKLDKTGGLTEALALADEAERLGLGLMMGCMVGTSLAMAPAMILAPRARFVDLDGPLLLAKDRENGLTYEGGRVDPPSPTLWG